MSDSTPAAPVLGPAILNAAERVLRRRFGGRPRIASNERLDGRESVLRIRIEGAGAAPDAVVLKMPRRGEGRPYDAADRSPASPAWFLTNEAAVLEFVNERQAAVPGPAVVPQLYGSDLEAGIILLEDLGDGRSLADILLGDNPSAAERAILAFARALGRMHALTAGRQETFFDLMNSKGRPHERPALTARVRDEIERLPETFDELEFEWTPRLVDDVQQVARAMIEPGPFYACTHGDPCPDNDRLIDDHAVLFDFERGGYRSAFMDGAYGRVPFPTCWCVNRLPDWLVRKFEGAYRVELMRGVPEAGDDDTFEHGLMHGAAFWLIANANQLLPRALRLEQAWGISTYRQRLLHRFQLFAQMSSISGRLEAMGAWAYLMGEKMRVRWPEVQEMPLYPAFR